MKNTTFRYLYMSTSYAVLTITLTIIIARVDSVLASATSPNEPAAFTTINDMPFDCKGCNGWSDVYPGNGNGTIVTDATTTTTGTASPTNVLQVRFPVGFQQGTEPVVMSYYLPGNRNDLYYSYWWKASNPWQGDTSYVNKQTFLWTKRNTTVNSDFLYIMEMNGPPGGPYHLLLSMSTQNNGICNVTAQYPAGKCGTTFLRPNTGNPTLALDTWHHIEVFIHPSSTITSNDGTIKYWLNGQLVGNYPTVNTEVSPWEKVQIAPTWGGCCGAVKTEQDFFWYDHFHISMGGSGLSADITPPVAPIGLSVQ